MPEQGGEYDDWQYPELQGPADRVSWIDVGLVIIVAALLAVEHFRDHSHPLHSEAAPQTSTPVAINAGVVSAPYRLSGRATPFE